MGQDSSYEDFHPVLLRLLEDADPNVRHNAALSLVRFNDSRSRPELVAMLELIRLKADDAGTVDFIIKEEGAAVAVGAPVARIKRDDGVTSEVRAPEAGRVESLSVPEGNHVEAGRELIVIAPETEQLWEALRALYIIGMPQDIEYVDRYARPLPGVPERVRLQAVSTAESIRERARASTAN
jgi:pyruvate/2-oxoglutarate dehydrogenase complex dihydrolipoamide acyltransferase (E2) component